MSVSCLAVFCLFGLLYCFDGGQEGIGCFAAGCYVPMVHGEIYTNEGACESLTVFLAQLEIVGGQRNNSVSVKYVLLCVLLG